MDVRLDDKRIPPYRLDRRWRQFVSRSDNQVVDLLERCGPQQAQVVPNPPPIKVCLVVPIADTHHQAQGAVLLCQILQLVVIEVATEPDCREYCDGPVTQPLPAAVGIAVPI